MTLNNIEKYFFYQSLEQLCDLTFAIQYNNLCGEEVYKDTGIFRISSVVKNKNDVIFGYKLN